MAAADDLDQVIEQYHQALDEFSRGNPDPVKEFYSGRDDVAIALGQKTLAAAQVATVKGAARNAAPVSEHAGADTRRTDSQE